MGERAAALQYDVAVGAEWWRGGQRQGNGVLQGVMSAHAEIAGHGSAKQQVDPAAAAGFEAWQRIRVEPVQGERVWQGAASCRRTRGSVGRRDQSVRVESRDTRLEGMVHLRVAVRPGA